MARLNGFVAFTAAALSPTPSRRLLLALLLLAVPDARGGGKRGGFHAYWSPHHGYAVFSNWDLCSKWATGPVASGAYHKGGFATPEAAAVAAATAGGLGLPVGDGWMPTIFTDAAPVQLAAPEGGSSSGDASHAGSLPGSPAAADPPSPATPAAASADATAPTAKRPRLWDVGPEGVQVASAPTVATAAVPAADATATASDHVAAAAVVLSPATVVPTPAPAISATSALSVAIVATATVAVAGVATFAAAAVLPPPLLQALAHAYALAPLPLMAYAAATSVPPPLLHAVTAAATTGDPQAVLDVAAAVRSV